MSLQRKYINLALLTIAVCTWLYVFYNFIFPKGEEQNTYTREQTQHKIENQKNTVISSYSKDKLKDPFSTPHNRIVKKTKKVVQPKPQVKQEAEPIRLVLLGIVSDDKGKMAIIKFPMGNTYFAREGEKIEKVNILKIENNEVVYKYSKKTYKQQL